MLLFYDHTTTIYDINCPDIYFTPEYGRVCEYSDMAKWELCQYKDLIYVYLKREYYFDNVCYYDLLTPYGYSGIYFEKEETFDEFIPLFRLEAKKRNYIPEVVRQNPYMDINISHHYELLSTKKIFSTEISNYDDYLRNMKAKARNIVNKAHKTNFNYTIEDCNAENMKAFIEMYQSTMAKVKATEYYYFNELYFQEIAKLCKIMIVTQNDKVVGQSLFMFYNKYIHYHLSCNDHSSNLITNFFLDVIIRTYGKDRKLILGGGLKDNDHLFKFKEKISTNSYDYNIYKNILNVEVYNKINADNHETDFFPSHRR